jgi:hypothetical protein
VGGEEEEEDHEELDNWSKSDEGVQDSGAPLEPMPTVGEFLSAVLKKRRAERE